MESTQWYVAVRGRTVGPVSTELLCRGLQNGKVPRDALVCALGDAEWQAVAAVSPFSHEVFGAPRPLPSAPPPPLDPFASARAVAPRRDNGAGSDRPDESGREPSGAEGLSWPPVSGVVSSLPPSPSQANLVMTTRAEPRGPTAGDNGAGAPATAGGDTPRFAVDAPDEGLTPSTCGAATPSTHSGPSPSAPPTSAVRGPTPLPPLTAPPPSVGPQSPSTSPAAPIAPAASPGPFGPGATASAGANQGPAPEPAAAHDGRGSVADVDVLLDSFDDETRPRYFNWQQRIVDFFRDVSSLNLPDESLLVGSLPTTMSSVLLQEDAMWNLALCVAFGSDRLADAAAEAFFHAQIEQPAVAGIDWMIRTLLSRGFMPSGIPSEAGEHAISVLRRHCPLELRAELERTLWD